MPRTGPRRENVVFRMGAAGIEHLDKRAEDEGLNRSEMVRIALIYALSRMPKGWRPS